MTTDNDREPTPRKRPWRELREKTQPRRGLPLRDAAIYCGIHHRKFARAVNRLEAPQPRVVAGQLVWDRVMLDEWLDRQPVRRTGKAPPRRSPILRL
jgi:predicted DNA-binding transcriptional regulator AlpA